MRGTPYAVPDIKLTEKCLAVFRAAKLSDHFRALRLGDSGKRNPASIQAGPDGGVGSAVCRERDLANVRLFKLLEGIECCT